MAQNNKTETIAAVVGGLATLWTTYKTSVVRRNETPLEALFGEFFGRNISDVDAALQLSKDVDKFTSIIRTKKTDKKFKQIIAKEY